MAGSEKQIQYYDGHTIYLSEGYYPMINIDGKNILLHRYIWEKYNGVIPHGYVIHHKDENKLNWNIENLELMSAKDHGAYHALEHGLGKSNKGKLKLHQSGYCSIIRKVIMTNGNTTLYFNSVSKAAEFLNVGTTCISRVCKGTRKTVKGWQCKYGS